METPHPVLKIKKLISLLDGANVSPTGAFYDKKQVKF